MYWHAHTTVSNPLQSDNVTETVQIKKTNGPNILGKRWSGARKTIVLPGVLRWSVCHGSRQCQSWTCDIPPAPHFLSVSYKIIMEGKLSVYYHLPCWRILRTQAALGWAPLSVLSLVSLLKWQGPLLDSSVSSCWRMTSIVHSRQ